MPDMIRDGHGTGYLAGVNKDGQLQTRAVTVEQRLKSAIDGNYYEITTGPITILNAVETPFVYIKNLEKLPLVIDRVFYDVWESTGGSGGGTLEYYRNPTISGGTIAAHYNTDFSNDDELDATILHSMTTMTGDEWWTAYLGVPSSVAIEEGRFWIPTGSSFGIAITPPVGNTSMKISINIAAYLFDKDLIN